MLQNFGKAVAEAKELLDKRAGRKPATDLQPTDFLDPTSFPDDPAEEPAEQTQLPWMLEPNAQHWQAASAASCLDWIRAAVALTTAQVILVTENSRQI